MYCYWRAELLVLLSHCRDASGHEHWLIRSEPRANLAPTEAENCHCSVIRRDPARRRCDEFFSGRLIRTSVRDRTGARLRPTNPRSTPAVCTRDNDYHRCYRHLSRPRLSNKPIRREIPATRAPMITFQTPQQSREAQIATLRRRPIVPGTEAAGCHTPPKFHTDEHGLGNDITKPTGYPPAYRPRYYS